MFVSTNDVDDVVSVVFIVIVLHHHHHCPLCYCFCCDGHRCCRGDSAVPQSLVVVALRQQISQSSVDDHHGDQRRARGLRVTFPFNRRLRGRRRSLTDISSDITDDVTGLLSWRLRGNYRSE